MRSLRVLVIGILGVASFTVMTSAQQRGIEIRDAAGPLEQQAKPLTPNTPLPRFKSATQPAEYPWELRRIGARAALVVQVTVDKSGRVVEARRTQGVLIQTALGSPNDADARTLAADAVMESTSLALKNLRFDEPAAGPSTFPVSFGFAGGQTRYALTDRADVLPAEAAPGPWAASQGALPTGQINPPKRTKYVKPVYPKTALDKRVQGTVQLEIVIGPDGRVSDARVLKSVPLLDQAAIEATMQARYEPSMVYGNPVSVVHVVSHTFSFKTKAE